LFHIDFEMLTTFTFLWLRQELLLFHNLRSRRSRVLFISICFCEVSGMRKIDFFFIDSIISAVTFYLNGSLLHVLASQPLWISGCGFGLHSLIFPQFEHFACIAKEDFFLSLARTIYPKAHSLPQTKKKENMYIKIEFVVHVSEIWKQLCATRTAKQCLTEREGILYPGSRQSERDEIDSSRDSKVITKPVNHHNGTESLPQTTQLVDRLVYFPCFYHFLF